MFKNKKKESGGELSVSRVTYYYSGTFPFVCPPWQCNTLTWEVADNTHSTRLASTRFAFVLALINTLFRVANARGRLDSCLLMPTYPFALAPLPPFAFSAPISASTPDDWHANAICVRRLFRVYFVGDSSDSPLTTHHPIWAPRLMKC